MARMVIVRRPSEPEDGGGKRGGQEPRPRHFDEETLAKALASMRRRDRATGEGRALIPLTKAEVDRLLERNGVDIPDKGGLDYVYVANMARADFWQSSLDDERHLALYVRDVLTDVDAPPGAVYARWAAMSGDGAPWDAE